jgi:50S ribosomal protein L16 3-hydroxylase
MKRHWQKKPLLVRQAIPGFKPLLERAALFDLAAARGRVAPAEPGRQGLAVSARPVRAPGTAGR